VVNITKRLKVRDGHLRQETYRITRVRILFLRNGVEGSCWDMAINMTLFEPHKFAV